jgi:hypothetical protein
MMTMTMIYYRGVVIYWAGRLLYGTVLSISAVVDYWHARRGRIRGT